MWTEKKYCTCCQVHWAASRIHNLWWWKQCLHTSVEVSNNLSEYNACQLRSTSINWEPQLPRLWSALRPTCRCQTVMHKVTLVHISYISDSISIKQTSMYMYDVLMWLTITTVALSIGSLLEQKSMCNLWPQPSHVHSGESLGTRLQLQYTGTSLHVLCTIPTGGYTKSCHGNFR